MTDIASLGIKIDTSDVGKAERDLDGLNKAGKDAEDAAKKVGSAWEAAASKISGDTGEIVRQLQALNKTQSATVASLAKLDSTVAKFGSEAARAASGVKTAATAVDVLAKSEKESANGVKVGTAAVQDQQLALQRLLGQIDPVVAAMARLDAQQVELQKFRNMGLIDGAAFDQNKAKIEAARAGLAGISTQLKQTGVSAGQTSAAIRMLPAQFTDVFVSLQAGQSPLQVLLQQGGQIKDSFGGIGPALRETGRYALALVNPFTIAAAAVAALAFAYKQGSDEQTAYNKAIILTGNYAGVSSAQLELMAQRLDKVGGTQRQAARTLAEFVSTGRFASAQLEGITAAAVAMENATGKAVSETVSEFVRLADSPVQAIAELNKAQRFLTAETYAAIVALDEQGRTAEAAELAIRTYSDATINRTDEIVDRLGHVEKAWAAVKKVAGEAWDGMLDIGREETDASRLEDLQRRLEGPSVSAAALAYNRGGIVGGVRNIAQQIADELSDSQSAIQAEIDEINKRIADGATKSAEQAAAAKIEAEGVEAIKRVDALGKAAETNAEKRKKALEQLARDIEKIRLANPNDSRLDSANIARLQADINNKFKDPAQKKAPEFRDDAAVRMLQTLRQQEASLVEQLGTEGKLTEAQRERARFEALIADLKVKGTLTADQKSLLANHEAIEAQLDRNAAIEEEIRLRAESIQLVEQLKTKEERAAELMIARLGVIDRMRIDQQKKGDLASRAVGAAQEKPPRFQGLSPEFGGEAGELIKVDDAGRDLEDWYSRQLEILNEGRASQYQANVDWNAKEQELKALHDAELSRIESARNQLALTSAESAFGSLAEIAKRGYGENSKQYKAMFAMEKTAAIARSAVAIQSGIAMAAANPWPVNLAAMASVFAATASIVGNIQAIGMAGFRDGGYTGSGGVNDVAGVVHGREFVFDADATSRIGVNNLEKLRAGRSIAMASANQVGGGREWRRSEGITIGQMVFPGVKNERDAMQAGGAVARQLTRAANSGRRYS